MSFPSLSLVSQHHLLTQECIKSSSKIISLYLRATYVHNSLSLARHASTRFLAPDASAFVDSPDLALCAITLFEDNITVREIHAKRLSLLCHNIKQACLGNRDNTVICCNVLQLFNGTIHALDLMILLSNNLHCDYLKGTFCCFLPNIIAIKQRGK